MKYKPVLEYSDKRASVKYKIDQAKRKRARTVAEKKLGKNYFTNPQAMVMEKNV